MTHYENVVIFDALLSDEEINTQIEKFKAAIEQLGMKIIHVEIWGRRRLAYPIKKRRDGFYIIYYFTLENNKNSIKELEKKYRISEAILRFMFVKLDQKASAVVLKNILKSEEKAAESPIKKEEQKEEIKSPEAENKISDTKITGEISEEKSSEEKSQEENKEV